MGWFWASKTTPELEASINPPYNQYDDKLTGALWASKADIWAEETVSKVKSKQESTTKSGCPVDHSKMNWFGNSSSAKPPMQEGKSTDHRYNNDNTSTSQCPVKHDAKPSSSPSPPPSACPVDHTKFNKLNNMPNLIASKLPGQQIDLPTDRTRSSIPRGEATGEGFWEYPSPQQMLNAMVRKSGREGIDEDAVESMVDVHNYLNEGVWQEVLDWEKPHTDLSSTKPRLLKFQGRPGDLSPRARMLQALGWIYPAKFGVPPPFDRHDWTVLRAKPGQADEWQKVRYVIDFYEIPDEDDEMPSFTVDVRPAVDSLGSVYDRARKAWGPVVGKALGW